MLSFLTLINKAGHQSDKQSLKRHFEVNSQLKSNKSDFKSLKNNHFFLRAFKSGLDPDRSGIFETERYLIQFDGLIYGEKLKRDLMPRDLFEKLSIVELFNDKRKLNSLPIRNFHLLIWDKEECRLLVFRDHLGVYPLYIYQDDEWLVLSSEIDLIRLLGFVRTKVNEHWIADALVNIISSSSDTFYQKIKLLEPGKYLQYQGGESTSGQYYTFGDPGVRIEENKSDLIEAFQDKLIWTITSYLQNHNSIGAELSGGLDSSAIVSIAFPFAQKNGIPFHTFSSILSEEDKLTHYPYSDELKFSSSLIKKLGIRSFHTFSGENRGVIEELKSHVRFMGTPTQQLFTLFSDEIYESAAESRIQVLLSGFGGDEGVSYNGAGFFEELAQQGRWELYLQELRARLHLYHQPFTKGFIRYLVERYIPFGRDLKRSLDGRENWKKMKIKGFGFAEDFGQRMNIRNRYYEQKGFPKVPDLRKRQIERLTHPHVSQRMAYAYQVGLKHGFSYSFPLLDRDLLEYHLSVPAEFKFTNGYGRALFRESLKGIVPEPIRLRIEKSGTTVPSVQKRMIKDFENIKKLIIRSQKENNYHYLDYEKMLFWQELLKNRQLRNDIPYNPSGFLNSIQILTLQEMERTGEYKTGIYY